MRLKVSLFFFFSFIPFASLSKATICRTYEKMSDEAVPKCAGQTISLKKAEEKSSTNTPECNECKEKLARLEEVVMKLNEGANKTKDQNSKLQERLEQVEEELLKTKELAKLIERKLSCFRKDCNDLADEGFTKSGVYCITVNKRVVFVYCDMETDGGKWTTIQRRMDDSQDFDLFWNDYVEGFGDVEREFWFGLENLHLITSSGSYQLRVDLEDWENNKAYALYSHFSIGDSASNYQLSISGYSGTAGDAISDNNNQAFSTRDRDNDGESSIDCVDRLDGAWWYRGGSDWSQCTNTNLNGAYLTEGFNGEVGITWWDWKGSWYSMKRAEMKIRRN